MEIGKSSAQDQTCKTGFPAASGTEKKRSRAACAPVDQVVLGKGTPLSALTAGSESHPLKAGRTGEHGPAAPQKRGSSEETSLPSKSTIVAGPSEEGRRERGRAAWTVLGYYAGDCDVHDNMMDEILSLQKTGSSPEMNIVVQIDRGETDSLERYGGHPGASRYYLQKSDESKLSSPRLADLGEVNSAHPVVLKDFLSWGMKNFPAKNYLIVASGHGTGVTGLLTDDNYQDITTLPELNSAISVAEKEAGVSPNRVLISLESCLMGQTETAYQLKDSGAYLLASQSTVMGEDFCLGEALAKPGAAELSLEEMGGLIFDTNAAGGAETARLEERKREPVNTQALLDLKKFPELKDAVLEFEKAVRKSRTAPEKLKEIIEVKSRPAFLHNTRFSHYSSDFYALAQQIEKDPEIKDRFLKEKAAQLAEALEKTVLKSTRKDQLAYNKHSHGLGVFTNSDSAALAEVQYSLLDFDQDTGWSKFLTHYAPKVSRQKMEQTLPDSRVVYPQLAPMAKAAQEGLKYFFPAGFAQSSEKIERIKADPSLDADEKFAAVKAEVLQSGYLGEIEKLNREAAQPQKQIIEEVLDYTAMHAYSQPRHLGSLVKTALAVVAGLEGEISTRALGQSARNLQTEKEVNATLGGELILILGYLTRNDKLTNLKNYYQDSAGELIRDLGRRAPQRPA